MKAVCLSCGAPKWGALTCCKRCGHHPESVEAQARHLLASEEHLSLAEMDRIGEAVAQGQEPLFDAEQVRLLAEEVARVPHAPVGFALLVVLVPLGLVLLVVALAVWALSG